MNERFRIHAAVALAGVLVLAGGYFVLGRSSSSSAAPVHQIKPLHPLKKHTQAKAKQALAPPKLALAKAKAPARRPSVIAGVPAPLSAALRHHTVVVLALVAPKSQVDRLTLAEAKAGAAAAHAGFAIVNVANNAQVEALSALVGSSSAPQNRLLDDPSVLVFQRPRTLYVRLNGYVDADTVEQAAVNAVSLSY
jgi:hypothetical protein